MLRYEDKKLMDTDSYEFLNLLLKLDNESKFMMMEPGERDTSLEKIQQHLSNIDESMTIFLGAYDNERLVGFINLSRGRAYRVKHSAYIVMGILSSHTGKGIGKLLFNKAEEWAKEHSVSRLELTVMVHNINAICSV